MTIGFIGGGNMATALISGFISSESFEPNNIFVFDIDKNKLSEMSDKFGITITSSIKELENKSDLIILAVKPNIMPKILSKLAAINDKIYISIAAGITLSKLSDGLGASQKIVRTMPNTPALIGCGMTVITPNQNVTDDEIKIIENLFSKVGETVLLSEQYMNAAIALHSSSPAYIFMLIDAMADSGVKYGLPKDIALKLSAKAVEGSAKMVLSSDEHPQKLKDKVCSPGGTTIAAVCKLEKTGFKSSVQSAIDACVKRAKNM